MERNRFNFKVYTLLVCIFTLTNTITAQKDYFAGYDEAIAGTNFAYHSPNSSSDQALLLRADKNFDALEWKTEAIPQDYKNKTVSFIWLYAFDVRPDAKTFHLSVQGNKLLSFSGPTNNDVEDVEIQGANKSRLVFRRTMEDRHGDQMGFAILTLPTKTIEKGKPVTIKVSATDAQSNAWYMTYKVALSDKSSAFQLNTVSKKDGDLFSTIRFNIIHLGPPTSVDIMVDNDQKQFPLKPGLNELDFTIPRVQQPSTAVAKITRGNRVEEKVIDLKPVKEWTVHLVQHSHTDIGYTRQQSEILAEHLRYIDDALDFCDQTDDYPENAKFRWTCEVSWTVREYLNSRPAEQVERLLRRIREGRIEVTGMFFNFSEIVDETALAIQTQTIKQFKEQGIDVTAAMQNDVNGIGWCMVDFYHDTGVKYLTMGQHGHRAHVPFNKPTSFWWESPSGNKLLAFRSDHYMHGNTLALTSGNMDVFRNNLSEYLFDLESKNYPMDRAALQFSGYLTDNSPPSTKACDIVKAWNEKYEWPKLKLSLDSEFMVYLDKNYGEQLDTKKVAWPDWWTDGFGSAMNETKTARKTQANMIATMGLMTMAQASGAKISEEVLNDMYQCYDNLLFYDEHTFGADESISNPDGENSINQWRQKLSYVWSANQQSNLLREKAIGLIQPYVKKSKEPSITIYNTLNWERSGAVEVYIDHDKLPLDKEAKIVDENGNEVPAQLLRSRSDGSYWSIWVKDVPPLGFTTYNIEVNDNPLKKKAEEVPASNIFENDFYRITLDLSQNGIASMYDKVLQRELVDKGSTYKLGTLIYELLADRREMERLTYQLRDTVYKPLNKEILTLSDLKVTGSKNGSIWKSLFLNGQIPKCADEEGLDIELRLYHQTKKMELLYRMKKLENTNAEGVFIAFPFTSQNEGKLLFEVQGGVVEPGVNQLEGTASDWNTVQNFATVKSNDSQIVFCTGDVPLVHFGGINTGRYYYKRPLPNSHIFSWVLNNYWVTNFKASQKGELKWKYQITSSEDNSSSFATRFGIENRVPMIARAYSAGTEKGSKQSAESIIDLNSPKNLLLVNSRPFEDGKGILLQVRETEGKSAVLDLAKVLNNPNITSAKEVNSLGEEIQELQGSVKMEHFETKFIVLELKS
ncbi:glycoside hydrolase family 38 C-terminal domain-containing protein [Flagellimonas nanhaiensis]|uniref:Glycosyl hydrolase family 38 n=1 Tax=Flagellimonas nanhaiensis TaxID=2292706 RepID=A0A371JUU2_9FLAO|nr:glycoside hydrolase family 38 C-terminal domain-containing protein [Allomuricauda nanhaiensis]RDY61572.1 glycosyl hydrolase family 38 [Allomuricauda nanhaiensis]